MMDGYNKLSREQWSTKAHFNLKPTAASFLTPWQINKVSLLHFLLCWPAFLEFCVVLNGLAWLSYCSNRVTFLFFRGHWAEIRTSSWLCTVAGTGFHMLIPNASISFYTSWHYRSNLLVQKVSWETQACKFLGLYQSFLTQGVCVAVNDIFCNSSAWTEETHAISGTQNICTRLRAIAQNLPHSLDQHLGTGVMLYQQQRQPCMATVKSWESRPWSKTWKTQDFANIKRKSWYFSHNCSLCFPTFQGIVSIYFSGYSLIQYQRAIKDKLNSALCLIITFWRKNYLT